MANERQSANLGNIGLEPIASERQSRREMAALLATVVGAGLLGGCDADDEPRSVEIKAVTSALSSTGTSLQWCDSYAELRALIGGASSTSKNVAVVRGSTGGAPFIGGGGIFVWSTDTVATDDGGRLIAASSGRTGCWTRLDDGTANVRHFGAKGDGEVNDTAAFQAWTAAIQAAGGGRALIPVGTYKIQPAMGGTVCAFSNLASLEIASHGTLADANSYSGSQTACLFSFSACRNVTVAKPVISTQRFLSTGYAGFSGLDAFVLLHGCANVSITYELTGGRNGVLCSRVYSDPLSDRVSGIAVTSKHVETQYPYVGRHSGDQARVVLDATRCGRNFYLYGVRDVVVDVISCDQQVTSQIAAYSGLGCENVSVSIIDTESSSCVSAAPMLELTYGDSVPATMRNIDVTLNLKNPVAAPRSHALSFFKASDGGGTPDSVGRGHVLDGFTLRGSVDNTGVAVNHIGTTGGAWAAPDVVRNFSVRDFIGKGASAIAPQPLAVLSGTSVWQNVATEGNIYTQNLGVGRVAFVGCRAANFSASTSSLEVHDYYSCHATDGSTQARVGANKTFHNFLLGATSTRPLANTGSDSPYAIRASKTVTGSLGGPLSLFRIAPLVQVATFRVSYSLAADQSDWNPATRKETFGVKSFTAAINSSGSWAPLSPVANDVAERTLNTPSVLTLSFVDGDANGAYLSAACTQYTGANARAVFSIEVLVASTTAWVEAV